ncbi:MAG TPA: hypothetical protein VF633_12660, partial [Brevundimonas sp.]
MNVMLAVTLAIAATPLQTGAGAGAGAPSATPVSTLQGRPLSEVLTRLGATRDPAPAITLQTAGGRMDLYPVYELMPATPEGQICDVRLSSPDVSRIASGFAVVQDGR